MTDKGVSVSHKFRWNSVSAYSLMCFSCVPWLISLSQTCWLSGSLQETLWENMWELTNSHSLTLSRFLSPCSDKSWNVALSSSMAASFFSACLRLAAACGSFPDQAGISGNVSCFRGAKSMLQSLSQPQTSTQTTTDDPQPHPPIHVNHHHIKRNH